MKTLRSNSSAGVSLLETVLAMVIMAIAFPALSNLFAGLTVTSQRPAYITTAEMLCVSEAEVLVADHRSRDSVNYGYNNLLNARYPDLAIPGYTNYSRQIRIVESSGNTVKTATVTIIGPFNVRAAIVVRFYRYTQP
ncbi:MAG: pectate lyase [bacterium]|nr:pectate lyase [bacterium]